MFRKMVIPSFVVAALLVGSAKAVDIEMVTVGNPGNAPDQNDCGTVEYEYQIGKYEITNAQWREFLSIKAAIGDPYELYNTEMAGTYGGIGRSGDGTEENPWVYYAKDHNSYWDNRPVNCVSFWDAARFCNWLHNGRGDGDTESGGYIHVGDNVTFARLPDATYFIPTVDEWYKAAYHKNDGVTGNYWEYPTGSDKRPDAELLTIDPGNNGNFYENGYTVGPPYFMSEIGVFESSESPYETFDQGGNVFEWTEDLYTSNRTMRGGSWRSSALRARSFVPDWRDPSTEQDDIGFRIASIVIPSVSLPGDLDGDGLINSRDLDIVRIWWEAEVEPGNGLMGDATGDGLVNSADLDLIRANWGVGLAAVPEPSVLFLSTGGVVLLAWRRHCRPHKRGALARLPA